MNVDTKDWDIDIVTGDSCHLYFPILFSIIILKKDVQIDFFYIIKSSELIIIWLNRQYTKELRILGRKELCQAFMNTYFSPYPIIQLS